MSKIELYNDDCLKVMDELIEKGIKVDAIIADPPYGTTACKWDSIIPFEPMWERLNKLIKDNGAIVLFGSEPFSSALRMSNIKMYKYDWVWDKLKGSSALNCKYQPIKNYENIIVFSKMASTYSIKGNMKYNPQGLEECYKLTKRTHKNIGTFHANIGKTTIQRFKNYPKAIVQFSSIMKSRLHPTQKPVALMEYLVKTYTNEGETVLDFTMGSGTTGVACKNLNRNFIGIEKEKKYYDIAKDRINNN